MKKNIFGFGKIILSAISIPLLFVKFFVDIGHLPDQTGNVHEVILRYSMFENISDLLNSSIAYVAVTLSIMIALTSIITNAIVIRVSDNNKLRTISNVFFIVNIAVFLVLLLFASTIARGY